MKLDYSRYELIFREPAITSRSTMLTKETYFIKVSDPRVPGGSVVGEVPLFRGLSAEDSPQFGQLLADYCRDFTGTQSPWCSSLAFGMESARDVIARFSHPVTSTLRIPINGLVWMGDKRTMYRRIREKLDSGFRCVKLKIGGIGFADELDLLRFIRREFGSADLELRVDANGAFLPGDALEKLKRLSDFELHSIEQPIKQGQWEAMRRLTEFTPVPIALDEELIGSWNNRSDSEMAELLDAIRPQYIILKPSLCGGFDAADRWISLAHDRGIGWWATSALESNVGLTAISLWLSKYNVTMPQGLGTGALYTNNFPSALHLEGDEIVYDPSVVVTPPSLDWL
ncbi:MAG: o-succinylbenzoate synthase [Muribaculaceae bacterium]|nr:o-succinylbenzoate synthase [Muribaculaceae bacterium]